MFSIIFDIPLLPLWSLLVHIEQQICWPWLYNQRLKHWSSACKGIHPSIIYSVQVGGSLGQSEQSGHLCRFKKSVQRNECLFLETILRLSVSATSRVSSNKKQHHAISLMNPLHSTSDFCCNWKLREAVRQQHSALHVLSVFPVSCDCVLVLFSLHLPVYLSQLLLMRPWSVY